jgi:hypothetical protein
MAESHAVLMFQMLGSHLPISGLTNMACLMCAMQERRVLKGLLSELLLRLLLNTSAEQQQPCGNSVVPSHCLALAALLSQHNSPAASVRSDVCCMLHGVDPTCLVWRMNQQQKIYVAAT